jgi:hypothetical protein
VKAAGYELSQDMGDYKCTKNLSGDILENKNFEDRKGDGTITLIRI